ncbi:MAG: MATE family efflux transporter [Clostridia bacterium]|nr:MATE family efflux transporter [Clostridia bacterium]
MKEKTQIQLSDHFTYSRLIRFTLPSIAMMIFTSVYGVVDGLFVSRFAGKVPFAAINLVMPLLIIMGAVGFMLGAGGTAIVSKTLGMKRKQLANEYFSLLVYVTAALGVILGAVGIIFARPVSSFLGAEGEMLDYCTTYARIVLLALPFFMLQNIFQSLFIAAEKPKLGLLVTVGAGVTNMVLDALFVGLFEWGLVGAAVATAISQFVGGIVPVIYFSRENTSLLRLVRTKFYGKMLFDACVNGSSELMSNIAMSVVTIFYNAQLMRFAGNDGIAAYGVIMYVAFVFVAIFIGFSIGSAPVIGYHYGADNRDELKNLRKKGFLSMIVCGVAMLALSIALAVPLCKLFVGYDEGLYLMTLRGFIIYAFSYLLAGINIFGSAFFTALNNGVISAVISFLRTLLFQCLTVILLPMIFELDGVWFSIIVSEILSCAVTLAFVVANRKKYGY